jgi:ABC-type tungstate transport system permease subunit
MRPAVTHAHLPQLTRLALSALVLSCTGAPRTNDVVLATTTSTRDTGLLDSLLPIFQQKTGYTVNVIAVGTGQAIALARRGDAQVVLVHAPEVERAQVDSGHFVRRRLVMHNDFLFVGPSSDPARLRGVTDPVSALKTIATARVPFVSRGDRSGTHMFEQKLWTLAGSQPPAPGPWYVEAGQGMAATLQMADEKDAYTITDHRSRDVSRVAIETRLGAARRRRHAALQRLSRDGGPAGECRRASPGGLLCLSGSSGVHRWIRDNPLRPALVRT